MKRLFAILLAATMLLAACGGTGTPTRGAWDGNTYSSRYIGLRFELPADWTVMTTLEMMDAFMFPESLHVMPGQPIPQRVFNSIGDAVFPDVIAYQEEHLPPFEDNGIMIAIGQRGEDRPSTEMELLQEMAAEAAGIEGMEIVVGASPVRIGNHDWHYADQIITGDWGAGNQRMYLRFQGDFMINVTIIYHDYDSLNNTLSHFRAY